MAIIPWFCVFLFSFCSLALGRDLDPRITGYAAEDLSSEDNLNQLFDNWTLQYNRNYTNLEERQQRFEVFRDNLQHIDRRNQDVLYFLGLNQFSDLTNGEYQARYTGYKPPSESRNTSFESGTLGGEPATSINWVRSGVVSSIKDQGACGSCWAFASVAAVESLYAIQNQDSISFSEQELVDCDSQSNGCDNGAMDYAYDFVAQNGLTSESDYPYTASQGTCDHDKVEERLVIINGYNNVPSTSERALMRAVTSQPVSVAMDASSRDFQSYASGIFTGDCGTNLDHATLAVGYGSTDEDISDSSRPYWLLKNSWGTSWGEDGYMRIERLSGSSDGCCGMYMSASYPTM